MDVHRLSCMLWMTLTSAAPVAVMSTAMDGKSAIRFLCFLCSPSEYRVMKRPSFNNSINLPFLLRHESSGQGEG